jgi:hypothetical protein
MPSYSILLVEPLSRSGSKRKFERQFTQAEQMPLRIDGKDPLSQIKGAKLRPLRQSTAKCAFKSIV